MSLADEERAALIAHSMGMARPAAAEPFDPGKHTVAQVLAYLDTVGTDAEFQRVVEAEAAGKNRRSIVEA